jgi:hypothetical protein
MSTTTFSSNRAVNTSLVACFFLVFWIVFKDAFRASLLFSLSDIGMAVFVACLFISFVAILQGFRALKFIQFDVLLLTYIFYSSMVTSAHLLLNNPYALTSYQIVVVFSFQCLTMLLLWYFSTKSPVVFVKVTNFVVRLAILGCILFGAILLTLVIVDLDLVFRFYGNLLELGIIVNPFQTSDDAIAVRYSGIFYSALNFGLFIVFSIILLFCGDAKVSHRKFVLIVLLLLLASSFNRNAFITLAYVGGAFFLFKVGMKKNLVFPTMVFGLCFIVMSLAFIVNLEGEIDQNDSFILSAHSLYSRFEIWSYWFNFLNIESVLYGYGVIAGMGQEHLYIDNGYIFMIVNSGIFSLAFLLLCVFHLTFTAAKREGPDADLAFFLLLGLPVAMVFNNIVLDPMLMLLFFFYPLALIRGKASNGG